MAGQTSRECVGIVVSDKMQKTVVVKVDRRVQHPLFKRVITRSKHYKVHDENNETRVGDFVRIRETRHLAGDKYHTLVTILQKAKVRSDVRGQEA